MTDKMDDLRKRVAAYFDSEASEPAGRLILDLLAWGQEQAAEAKAWKHANAVEPLTAEELAEAVGFASKFTAEKVLAELPLYKRKP
jgi:hypothetical protein